MSTKNGSIFYEQLNSREVQAGSNKYRRSECPKEWEEKHIVARVDVMKNDKQPKSEERLRFK